MGKIETESRISKNHNKMIEIFIRSQPGTVLDELFIVERLEWGKRRMRALQVENNQVVWMEKEIELGSEFPFKPFMVAESSEIRDIVQAFMKQGGAFGIENPSEAKVHGLYESQSRHLDDLRSILKLKK